MRRPKRNPVCLSIALFAGLFTGGCGPSVSEVRLMSAPAREPSCTLDFLELRMEDVAPGAKYEVLGHVVVGEEGRQNPLAPEYRAIVRPRACAMGGEAVAILSTASVAAMGFSSGATSVSYAVVRRRREPLPQDRPTKF